MAKAQPSVLFRRVGETWTGWYGDAAEYWLTFKHLANGRSITVYDSIRREQLAHKWFVGDWNAPFVFSDWNRTVARFIRTVVKDAQAKPKDKKCKDAYLEKNYPAIMEYLTLEEVDGETREGSKLNIRWTLGRFQCYLNDGQTAQTLFCTGDTFLGLLTALEGLLASPEPGWREQVDWNTKKKGKKA